MQMPVVGTRWRFPFVGAPVARNLTALSLTGWTNSIQYARTAPHVYPQSSTPDLNSFDHYDPPRIFQNVINYTGDATWSTQLNAAILQIRDETYIANGGFTQGYHAWSTGVRMNYELTNSAASRNAAIMVGLNAPYAAETINFAFLVSQDASRECAFSIINHIELENFGTTYATTLATRVTLSKGHINQWIAPPSTRYWGTYTRPFMMSLTFDALVFYYDKYRDSTIPPLIKQGIDWIWDNMYLPGTKSMEYTDIDTAVALAPISCVVADASPTTLAFKATGTPSLSTQDGYYTTANIIFTSGVNNGVQATCTGYNGSLRQFLFGINGIYTSNPGTFASAPSSGDTFTINSLGYNTGTTTSAPDLNLMIAPMFSWYYKYSGDPTYRTKHDLLFQGSSASLGTISTQKIYNQCYRTSFQGLNWRSQGDTAWTAATTYTLTAPSPSSGLSGVISQLFTVALSGGNVSTSTPVVVTPSDSGSGTFFPATVYLTTDRPSATFRYHPAIADSGVKTISVTNSGGLSNPGSVSYTITGPGTLVTGFTVLGTTTCTSSQTMTLQYATVPSGATAMPSSADAYAGSCNINCFLTGSAGGALTWTGSNPTPYTLPCVMLAGDSPTFDFIYLPANPGVELLHSSSVGLTSPGNVTLTVTGINPQFGFQIIIGTYNPAFNTE